MSFSFSCRKYHHCLFKQKPIEAPRRDVTTIGLINRKKEQKMTILGKKVIQPWYKESSLLKSHKPYHQIHQASLKDFFTQVLDRIFSNLVRESYLNLRLVGTSLRSYVMGVEINIYMDNFGRTFELLFKGKSYTRDKPLGFRNLKHFTTLNSLVINPMEKRKSPLKSIHLKPKVWNLHYLQTIILFPRNVNHNYVIREDVVALWILTHEVLTNWVEEIFNHMIFSKENHQHDSLMGL